MPNAMSYAEMLSLWSRANHLANHARDPSKYKYWSKHAHKLSKMMDSYWRQ